MGKRYGIVGYNGTRKVKRPKPLPPKLVKEEPAMVVEDTVEVVTVKEEKPVGDCWGCMMSKECCTCKEVPEVTEPEVFETICKAVVEAGDLKEEAKEELTKLWVEEKAKPKKKTYKKKKYEKRKKSTVTSSSALEVPLLPVPTSPEDPSTD